MRLQCPEAVWQREGRPNKVSLGSRASARDWDRYRATCPKTLETAELLLASLVDQAVEVTFGDVLDYQPGHALGWHQDSMDTSRHTFTAVLTLSAEGEGRFEWREIAADGQSLGETVASTQPEAGDLAIHGLACNNALAHRVTWAEGRRVTLVLFCRSQAMGAALEAAGLESRITMRHWWRAALAEAA